LRHLFNAVTEDDILRYENSKMTFRGDVVNQATLKELVNGAQALQKLNTHKMLMQEMKYVANKRIYQYSKTNDDILFGKAMLLTIDILEKKIDNISKL